MEQRGGTGDLERGDWIRNKYWQRLLLGFEVNTRLLLWIKYDLGILSLLFHRQLSGSGADSLRQRAFGFLFAFPWSRFQPQGVILRNGDAKDKFLPIVAVDLFNRVANGHSLHKWNLRVWIIDCHQKKIKNVGFHNAGRVSSFVLHSSWSLKTTQHLTTSNFRKKEIHWPWQLGGHFKVEVWSSARCVLRGLRGDESGISVLLMKKV